MERFALGTLVQARERDLMNDCVSLLTRDLPPQPDACCWLLSMLRRFPATLKELLLSPEDAVREASGLVIKAALKGAMLAAGGAGDQVSFIRLSSYVGRSSLAWATVYGAPILAMYS